VAINIARVFVEIGTKNRGFTRGVQGVEKRLGKLSSKLNRAGMGMTMALTAPIAAIGGLSLKAASDFETAFAGVRKTVNATTEEYEGLAKGIRDMSQRIPVTAEEIAAVTEEAGRLGVAKENLLAFTEQMIRLAETSTLGSTEAAVSLARLANITKMPQENFDRLASTITVLGSTYETTESEIAEFSLRIAKTGNQVGLTEVEITALATALSAVGIKAEAGGTAVSRIMGEMALDVDTNAERLKIWAAVSRKSVDEFSRDFRESAMGAIQDFMRGLGNLEGTGVSALQILKEMKFENIRVRDAFLGLAGASEKLDDILGTGNQAWRENAALVELSNRRFETTGAQTTILTNQLKEQQRQLGEALIPAYRDILGLLKDSVVPAITDVVTWFGSLDEGTKKIVLSLGALVALSGPVLLFFGQLSVVLTVLAAHPIIASIVGLGLLASAFLLVGAAGKKGMGEVKRAITELEQTEKRIAAIEALLTDIERQRLDITQLRTKEALALSEATKKSYLEDLKAANIMQEGMLAEEKKRKVVLMHEDALEKIAKRNRVLADTEGRLREELTLTKQSFAALSEFLPETDAALLSYRDRIFELTTALEELQASQSAEWAEAAKAKIQEVVESHDAAHLTMEERVKNFQDSNKEAWTNWLMRGQEVSTQMSGAFLDLYQGMSQGFGNVVAEMAIEGTSFTKLMDQLWKSLAGNIISSLVAIGVQWVLTTIIGKTAAAAQHIGRMGQLFAQSAAGAFAATAAIPIVGPFLAPGAALAALAAVGMVSSLAYGAGSALGAAQSFHQGGMSMADGWAIIQRHEVVLTPDQVRHLGRGETTAIFEFDAEAFAKAVIPKIPGVYRRKMGGTV
jgi:TP901 family phage tail tape measure protein